MLKTFDKENDTKNIASAFILGTPCSKEVFLTYLWLKWRGKPPVFVKAQRLQKKNVNKIMKETKSNFCFNLKMDGRCCPLKHSLTV